MDTIVDLYGDAVTSFIFMGAVIAVFIKILLKVCVQEDGMGDLIAMVKDAVVPLAGFMAVTAMLGVVIVMYKQTIKAVINTLLYRQGTGMKNP